MPRFFELSSTITKLGFCFTFIINLIFINITLSYTRVITGTYRKMLVTFATTCIVFSAIEIIVHPYIHNFNGGLVYFSLTESTGEFQTFLRINLIVYSACYITQIVFIAMQFLFRYFIVTQSRFLESFKGVKQLFWVFYLLAVGFIYGTLLCFCLQSDDYSEEYMRAEIEKVYGRNIKDTPRVLAVAYENGQVRLGIALFLSFGSFLIGLQYAIIIICAVEMRDAMNTKLQNLSSKNRRLEKQFFKALTFQILLPTVLLTIPVGIVLILPLLDLKISLETGGMFVLYSFYPPLDTIATMMIIKEYRYSLMVLWKDLKGVKIKQRGSQAETTIEMS